MIKHFYLFSAFLSLMTGFVGIFIPVWPTTPFVLLSIWLFNKTDTKFSDVLIRNRWIGKHLRNYIYYKKMNKSFKLISILFLWTGLGISIHYQSNIFIDFILLGIGLAVTIHIILLNDQSQKKIQSALDKDSSYHHKNDIIKD